MSEPGTEPSEATAESDAAWLHDLFVAPERDLALLPEWALPVITPPRPDQ